MLVACSSPCRKEGLSPLPFLLALTTMPRPGPRPYECIRRAWHSDGHQPLRGALIQEIFRVVNELHSTSTRRKKEWQEKLPIVVLRAEEILYSKANSESEYAGVDTLRTRLDDAVNTMIRRDDTEEEGVYLAPCVEAALSLGCTPKKVPRGQRQVASRLATNSTRRNNSASTINGGYKAIVGSGSTQMRCVHEKSTSSSLRIVDTQLQAMPMEPSSLYSSAVPPLGPNACHTTVFPPNFAMLNPFNASCPFTTTFPQLGSLVQFLKGGDNMNMLPESLDANLDLRSQQYNGTSMSHFPCRESTTRANISTTFADIPTQMSLSPSDTRMITQMQQMGTASDTFYVDKHKNPHMLRFLTTPHLSHTSPISVSIPSHLSTSSQSTSTPSVDGSASSHACFDDLQLRLGPPRKEASSTSVMISSGASAPKRLRVDNGKLDVSTHNADQFQLCNLPLSQQPTWS